MYPALLSDNSNTALNSLMSEKAEGTPSSGEEVPIRPGVSRSIFRSFPRQAQFDGFDRASQMDLQIGFEDFSVFDKIQAATVHMVNHRIDCCGEIAMGKRIGIAGIIGRCIEQIFNEIAGFFVQSDGEDFFQMQDQLIRFVLLVAILF